MMPFCFKLQADVGQEEDFEAAKKKAAKLGAIKVSLICYYCLLLRELFSYSVVWWGIVPSPLAQALYLTKQHNRIIVLEGEDNNIFST